MPAQLNIIINVDTIYDYGLYLIDMELQRLGSSLSRFPSMPTWTQEWNVQLSNRLLLSHMSYDPQVELERYQTNYTIMNLDQKAAIHKVMHSVEHKKGDIFFISGPAGTGKTFCYSTLCHAVRGQEKIVLCVASSGIAALLLKGGRTAHSMFKIPLDIKKNGICSISKQSQLAEVIQKTELIIWDEAPMQHRYCAEAVDNTLRDLLNKNDIPFGGMTVVFGEDFQQILPVVLKGSWGQTVTASLLRSRLWDNINLIMLTENMHLIANPENQEYAEWLQRVGRGEETAEDGSILLDEAMKCENDITSLINSIYPSISQGDLPEDQYFLDRTILCTLNEEMLSVNTAVLEKFSGQEYVFQSADNIHFEEGVDAAGVGNLYPPEYLNSINHSGLPPSKLVVKLGCPLMLLRNIDPQRGLCNGTRCVLLRCTQNVLEVRILGPNVDEADRIAFIPWITLYGPEEGLGSKFS